MDAQSALLSLGLERKTAEQAASNPKLCQVLEAVLDEAGLDSLGKEAAAAAAVPKTVGKFVYAVTCKVSSESGFCTYVCVCPVVSNAISACLSVLLMAQFPSGSLRHRPLMLGYIVSEGIKTQTQYDAGIKFLEKRGPEDVDPKEFEAATGVGEDGQRGEDAAAAAADDDDAVRRIV